jgi:MoaA/NifB/PqqE/SkfB family radical SAM enzyme
MKHVMIDISTACGAKCKYCLHQYRNMVLPQFMSWETFIKIMVILERERYDYVYPYLSGEPILNSDYWKMVRAMSALGITTNTATKLCFRIDEQEMRGTFMTLKAPMYYDITIDAPDQTTQDNIAKHIDNDLVFSNLEKLATEARGRQITITVVTVVNRYNELHLKEIQRRVRDCGVLRWAAKPMGYYMGYRMQPEDEEMISDMAPAKSTRFSVVDGHIVSKMKQCGSFLKPVIGPTGNVTICCHDMLYREADWNILKVGSLDRINNGPEYQHKLELARKMQLKICEGCN